MQSHGCSGVLCLSHLCFVVFLTSGACYLVEGMGSQGLAPLGSNREPVNCISGIYRSSEVSRCVDGRTDGQMDRYSDKYMDRYS